MKFTVENLKKWLTKFVKGDLQEKETGFGEVIDVEIKYILQNTKLIKRPQFIKEVYEEGTDTFLFIYTTAIED